MMSKSCHRGWENRCLNKKLKSVKSSSSSSSFFFSVPLYLILCFFFSKELSPQPPFHIVHVGKLPVLLSHVAALGYNLNDI